MCSSVNTEPSCRHHEVDKTENYKKETKTENRKQWRTFGTTAKGSRCYQFSFLVLGQLSLAIPLYASSISIGTDHPTSRKETAFSAMQPVF